MKANAQSYSKEYGLTQQKIADGYQDLIKRGYSSSQALGSMKTLVKGAIATGDDF
jgi:Phage-related minor tail protein.